MNDILECVRQDLKEHSDEKTRKTGKRFFKEQVALYGVKTAVKMNDPEKSFGKLYLQVKEKGLIDCACQACSSQMGVLDEIKEQGLPLCSDMKGHPSLARYMEDGYRVITF